MGHYKLLHKATNREIRGGARLAMKTIQDVLDDRRSEIRQVDIAQDHDTAKIQTSPPYGAFDRIAPTGHTTVTITLKVFRKAKSK